MLKPLLTKTKFGALAIAIVAFATILIFPIFSEPMVNRALAILIIAALLWMTEAIPLALTALVIPTLAIFLRILPSGAAFGQFANPVIFLFMGGFVLAGALSSQSLDKQLAQKLIGFAKGNFYKSAILLMLTTSLVACWIGNTSSTAMMIPLALGLLGLANRKQLSGESKFLMLGIAYSANIGGVITMIATPPNAIGGAILDMSFSDWLKYGIPIFLITFPIMVLIMTIFFQPDRKLIIEKIEIKNFDSPNNKKLIIIFLLTVVLWMSDGIIAPLLNIVSGFNALVAIFAIFLLYIFNIMNWTAILESIRWDILLLFGGGLTLGVVVDSSGLGNILVAGIMSTCKDIHLFFFLWLIILFTIALTEFMSNTASAALILPLLYTLAIKSNINPIILVLPATFATSYGFMLPVGTPPNAMVFSSGFIPQREMIKVGFIINILFSIILTSLFYFVFL